MMTKDVKVWGLIVVLMVLGSIFSGAVSAENVSEDLAISAADAESFDKSDGVLNSNSSFAEYTSSSVTIRVKRSTYGSGQIETLNLESEYLPVVVSCENGGAPYESMKAQAIAARTFAMYKKIHPQGADFDVYDDTRDQVYNPAKTVTNQHRQSVTDTKGVVLEYTGDYHTIICAFYVSGTGSTAQYVTYNEGKSGNDITQTSLGYRTNPPSKFPDNRGCMGQVQANNLASSNGYDYQQILRYFYGSDIEGLGSSGTTLGEQAAALAEAVIGAPYLWGGKGWNWNPSGGWNWPDGKFVDSDGSYPSIKGGYYYYKSGAPNNVAFGKGLDCSGLSFWAFNKAAGATKLIDSSNPIYYEGASGQWTDTARFEQISTAIPTVNDLNTGYLLFLDTPDGGFGSPDHVGMYVGNGYVIHSKGGVGVEKKTLNDWLNIPYGSLKYRDYFFWLR